MYAQWNARNCVFSSLRLAIRMMKKRGEPRYLSPCIVKKRLALHHHIPTSLSPSPACCSRTPHHSLAERCISLFKRTTRFHARGKGCVQSAKFENTASYAKETCTYSICSVAGPDSLLLYHDLLCSGVSYRHRRLSRESCCGNPFQSMGNGPLLGVCEDA